MALGWRAWAYDRTGERWLRVDGDRPREVMLELKRQLEIEIGKK